MKNYEEPLSNRIATRIVSNHIIIPTGVVFQGGIGSVGACELSATRSNTNESEYFKSEYFNVSVDRKRKHNIEDMVSENNAERIGDNIAVIFSFVSYRSDLPSEIPHEYVTVNNSYASRFYPFVIEEIRRRGLDVLSALNLSLDFDNKPITGTLGVDSVKTAIAGNWIETKKVIRYPPVVFPPRVIPVEDVPTWNSLTLCFEEKADRMARFESVEIPFFSVDKSEYFLSSVIGKYII